MQTPAPLSIIVVGATLLRDRGLLLPALLLPASCKNCSRLVVLARRGPAKDAARASSVSESASLDTLDCARIGLDSLCSNMATCFALLVPLARTVIPPRHFALKGSAARYIFVLWANWCACGPPQVLSPVL